MRSPIGMPMESGAPRCGQWSSSMTGAPVSSRHRTSFIPTRRSEIGLSPRKCEGQIGYQMFRTPLARSLPIAWLVTAVMVDPWIEFALRAEPLHLLLEQLRRPGPAARRRDLRLVQPLDQSREIVHAGGVAALDSVA